MILKLDELKCDHLYNVLYKNEEQVLETMIVTFYDIRMKGTTLRHHKDSSTDRHLGEHMQWNLATDEPSNYRFIDLGHKNDHPEYWL